ncbi:cytochrome c biogenesis protein ResB [Actinopolymorpha sp. NPDC004070]|uniref:cytochrome c biogenesis protein ResB n=1 Tax=Actinopolymorpha sp. NPDC004070 TaxID=3154548 RepID=UPI0033B2E0B7
MASTQQRERETSAPKDAPPLGPWELARWVWRQLTSMRTALILLFLLAVASIPGTLIPQRRINPVTVAEFIRNNPGLSRWYERFGLFDVFGSPWFGAIYLLLLVSLLGCILPRTLAHWRLIRSRPPVAPRRLERLSVHRSWTTDTPPEQVLAAARERLRAARYRVVADEGSGSAGPAGPAGSSLSAERGYLREVGNLLFHMAIVVVLVGVAIGSLFGFRGTVLVVVGNGFANTVTQYDGYQSGGLFKESQLAPFSFTVKSFKVKFATNGEESGSPRSFDAALAYTPRPGASTRDYHLRINHPLHVDGTDIHLSGHGYAPRFTVRDGTGKVAFSGPVPFLPQDSNFSSTGVVKVPDARPRQFGFEGFFLPTGMVDQQRGPISAFPDALRPMVFLTGYSGNLGLDEGVPQSVYSLDKTRLTQLKGGDGPWRKSLEPGQTASLPGGGSIRFDGYTRWVNLQISSNPGAPVALVGAVLALAGLLLSLVVRRRRVWVRVASDNGRTVVAIAGMDKGERLSSRAPGVARVAPDEGDRAEREGRPGSAGAADDETRDLAVEIDRIAAGLPGRAAPAGEET